MKIGNIVSNTTLSVPEDFNVVKSLTEIINGLPTLIIGWDYVKKNYPNYNIVERKLSENLFWTFKKTEKRDLHEEDIFNFVRSTYSNLTNKISYVFIDPIIYSRNKIKKIINKINSFTSMVSYHHDDMVYIYSENLIFGIDLKLLAYIGLNRDKMVTRINNKSMILLTKDSIFIEYKNRIETLDNQVKYVPFLYSIENV